MENYLYFAEAVVETGDDLSSEALCVPASSYIGADPGSGTTTLRFKNAMGDSSSIHKVILTHTAGNNKAVMKGIMNIINAGPHNGGFTVVTDFETGTATTKSAIVNKELSGLGVTSIAITETEHGGVVGVSGGTTNWHSYGAGMISTEVVPQYNSTRVGDVIVSTVAIDLTGLANKSDDGDIIGLAAGGAGYFAKYVTAEMGILFKVEVSCLELPTASSNVGLDFDIEADATPGRVYDTDASGYRNVFTGGGDFALNQTIQDLGPTITANDYLFLVTGATHTGDSTHTAGKLLITMYGHPTF